MADERTRPLYVVPDTNYLLHGRPLDQLTPESLGLQGPITAWILVMTVVDELDEQKYESRIARKRASNALDYLYDNEGPQKLAAGVPVEDIVPRAPIAYDALGFESTSKDDKICAQIKDFEAEHPEADVVLLTLDDRMRSTRAKRHKITVVKRSLALELRIADEDDPIQRELDTLRREARERAKAAPDLKLSFACRNLKLDIPVFPRLSGKMIDVILNLVCAPELDGGFGVGISLGIAYGKKNPQYKKQLKVYREQLREILPRLWTSMGLSKTIPLSLSNDGDVQANDVTVKIVAPAYVRFVNEPTESPALPNPPNLYVPYDTGLIFAAQAIENRDPFSGFTFGSMYQTGPLVTSHSGPNLRSDGSVQYWRKSVRQSDSVELAAFNVELDQVPSGIRLDYEIRAENIVALHSGHMILRPVAMDNTEAINKVWRAIIFETPAKKKQT